MYEVELKSYLSDFPEDLSEWFGKLHLLYGVPYNYLIPDDNLLPEESIRFFHVDKDWVTKIDTSILEQT